MNGSNYQLQSPNDPITRLPGSGSVISETELGRENPSQETIVLLRTDSIAIWQICFRGSDD
jgi:hypothetical protein